MWCLCEFVFASNMFFIFFVWILSTVCVIWNKLRHRNCRSLRCLVGKTAVVTGGNAGIGYEICMDLATRGCKVIIADKDDSSSTREEIIRLTHNPNIISKQMDLSNFASVRDFAKDVNFNERKVDILIHNAGIGGTGTSCQLTVDGFNPVMQVNYLGPFLLTHLLLDTLRKSESGRIIFTSSSMAFMGKIKLDMFVKPQKFGITSSWETYSGSKLAVLIGSDAFAEKLMGTGVTSNSLHPGEVLTNIFNTVGNSSWCYKMVIHYGLALFGKTCSQAAQTTLYLAFSDEVQGITGQYFWNCRQFWKPSLAQNSTLRKKLWDMSEKYAGLKSDEKIE